MENLPKILFGTGASAPKNIESLKTVVKTALKNGIYGFDAAPSYKSEKVLSDALKEGMQEYGVCREKLFIQTKIDAWQMQMGAKEVRKSVEKAMTDMDISYLDSLLVHWPVPEYFEETWKVFSKLKEEKLVNYIGVSNVRKRHLEKMVRQDTPPQIVQIERNPLMTFEEEIDFSLSQGIFIQAYSPLCKMDKRIAQSAELLHLSQKYGKSIGQIVLRWHIDTGVAPVFTSTKPDRIKEYSEIFDFSLSGDEIEKISDLNENYKMYLEAWACPGF